MKPSSTSTRVKKQKTQHVLGNKNSLNSFKKKRASCMLAKQFSIMEESPHHNAKFIIQTIFTKFQAKLKEDNIIKNKCLQLIQANTSFAMKFQLFNCQTPQDENINPKLQNEPTKQPAYKVDKKMAKQVSVRKNNSKQNLKVISNLKLGKLESKDKLLKLKNRQSSQSITSSNSIFSQKSNLMLSHKINNSVHSKTIEEEKQTQEERQKRKREEIIKKLKKQYLSKCKQNQHLYPQPIKTRFRQSFAQNTKQDDQIRASIMHLKQMKQSKYLKDSMNTKNKQKSNKTGNDLISLPYINRNKSKQTTNSQFYAHGQNGETIKIRKNQNKQIDHRQHSLTTHESFHQLPKLTALRQISNTFTIKHQLLRGQKAKQTNFVNESTWTTPHHELDDDLLEKSIIQKIPVKIGSVVKKSIKFLKAIALSQSEHFEPTHV